MTETMWKAMQYWGDYDDRYFYISINSLEPIYILEGSSY